MTTLELTFEIKSLAETGNFAQRVATAIQKKLEESRPDIPTIVICLNGSLGAGKTTFVSSLCVALGVKAEDVSSPTFSLQNIYRGCLPIHHFDFYRLKSEDEVFEIGFEEQLQQPGLYLIEWSNKFPDCISDDHLRIEIESTAQSERTFRLHIGNSSNTKTEIAPVATSLLKSLKQD